ncbi:MAG: alpha-L-fucosidase [Verrucomicrobiota bacterium]
MKRHLPQIVAGIVTASFTLSAFAASPDREATLRFPPKEAGKNAYVEVVPNTNYMHASEAAYQAFRDLKYGVRIHWGLYSQLPAARESWTFLGLSDAERQAYLESYKQWNPQGFNAEEWMQFFERAGFKCFAITTKHHEGFSLFDTKTRVHYRPNYSSPSGPTIEQCDLAYSVMDTPFKRDIIKELCDAAHQHSIKINLYFSHSDWYDADFRPYGRHPLQTSNSPGIKDLEERQHRPAKLFPDKTPLENARMIARHKQQLRELLTNYGKIDMVCLDIGMGPEVWPQLRETIMDLRKLQPEVMFRNRGIGNYGDYYTPERVVPGDKETSPMPWMVIYPLGKNFSWEGEARQYKGAKWVVDNLADSVAKGGNFMVGIGPDGNGRFHPTALAQLEEVGAWLKINGEGIFDTCARPGNGWKDGESVRLTQSKDGKYVYAIVLSRPGARLQLHSVQPVPGSSLVLLGHPDPLPWHGADGAIEVEFPSTAKDALAYTLKIQTQPL